MTSFPNITCSPIVASTAWQRQTPPPLLFSVSRFSKESRGNKNCSTTLGWEVGLRISGKLPCWIKDIKWICTTGPIGSWNIVLRQKPRTRLGQKDPGLSQLTILATGLEVFRKNLVKPRAQAEGG